MKNERFAGAVKLTAGILGGISLIIAILILSVHMVCFDRGMYADEYKKEKTAIHMQTTDEELMEATEALLLYIQGDRDTIMVDVEIDGETVPFYNEREAEHMIDVKVLYENAMTVMWVCIAAFAVLTALQLILFKKQGAKSAIKGFFAANIISAAIIAALAVFLLVDFDTFWTSFHHVFFSNDLWQMNIFTDRMIQLFSGGDFFFTVCVRVVLWAVGIDVLLLLVAFAAKRKL